MLEINFGWSSPDGVEFFAHTWKPEVETKAAITLVHGFGEHCLRYTSYFKYFVERGIAIVGFDLRGHGQTGGKRGAIKSYSVLMDDIATAVEHTKKQFPDVPHFIYGHSMGGNIALNFLLKRNPVVKGGVISSPWLALTNDPNFILKSIVSFLKRFLPNTTVDSGLENNHISTDKKEVEKYRSDPLNHGRISFRLFSDITGTGIWAVENSGKLQIPVLLMHGNADRITSHHASKRTAKNSNGMIEYVEWEGRYHELHNETNRSEVAERVIGWIEERL